MPDQDIETQAREVLQALALRKNVIITGPPGTGKSRLINMIKAIFETDQVEMGADPAAQIPVPPEAGPLPDWMPSPDRVAGRRVFATVFDQNTKYRDFMRGITPKIDSPGAFTVTSGTLFRASEYAKKPGHASLVIVDEINRGPAVAAFGSALVSLEPDKRLNSDGTSKSTTQTFEILSDLGENLDYALPEDLYILAAMNEADTSVEPLDVAFLRRFAPYRLEPDVDVLRKHLGLEQAVSGEPIPATAATAADVYRALVSTFQFMNARIGLARGSGYQLGHGALMHRVAPTDDLIGALTYAAEAWATMKQHLDEVFFGDTRALSDLL